MFFRHRSMQAEFFDLPDRPPSESIAAYAELDRLNRFCHFSRPFEDILPHWLGTERCRRLDILDIGAGTGLLGRRLGAWARRRGWDWRFTNLDSSPVTSLFQDSAPTVIDSALTLPFQPDSFDLVIACQMTHHLTDTEVEQHLREALRVSRDAVLVSDLHRNVALYVLLWLCTLLLRISHGVRADALLSVKRGFHLNELRNLADRGGVSGSQVWLYFGTRIILQARKARPGMSVDHLRVASATSATSGMSQTQVECCSSRSRT
jgi:SAM-dependent methyltransferase